MKKLSIFGLAILMLAMFATGTSGAYAASKGRTDQGKPGVPVQGKLNLNVFDGAANNLTTPLVGAGVTIFDDNGQLVVSNPKATDVKGSFSAMLIEGKYSVTITATGYDGYSEEVKLITGETTNLTVYLNLTPSAPPIPMPEPGPCLSCQVPPPPPSKCVTCVTPPPPPSCVTCLPRI